MDQGASNCGNFACALGRCQPNACQIGLVSMPAWIQTGVAVPVAPSVSVRGVVGGPTACGTF